MKMNPPKCTKVPFKIEQHGIKRIDNYHWLRDKNWQQLCQGKLEFENQDVLEYLKLEEAYTNSVIEGTEDLQKKIYKEIVAKINEDDDTPPMKWGDYYYYSRIEKGNDYYYRCRKKGSLDAQEEIYFDDNVEAEGLGYFSIGEFQHSPDNKYSAYSVNTTGSMEYSIKVRDLETGKDFDWEILATNGSYCWDQDYQRIYYVERDPNTGRGYKLNSMEVFKGIESIKTIYEKTENLKDHFMGLDTTTDKRFVKVDFSTTDSNELYYFDNSEKSPELKLFWKLEHGVRVEFEHHNGSFLIQTNEFKQINSKVMKCSTDNIDHTAWVEFIPERKSQFLEWFEVKGDCLIQCLNDNEAALRKLVILNLNTKHQYEVEMKDEVYYLSYAGSLEFNSPVVQFQFESPIRPSETIELELATGKSTTIKKVIIEGLNPDDYEVKREFATAHDGEKIPLSIFYKKGTPKNSSAPGFVYAYGSYGHAMPAYYAGNRFPLLERGFVYTIAHIRGGADKGYGWYLDGKMKNKLNSFKDFNSSTEYLVKQGYIDPKQVVANGGSAGGLLMGGIANMRPDLYNTVILDVPFVDVINTISDETLPLTPPEWEEWGNPITNKEDYQYMMQYSPYDNVKAKEYPNMLFNSGITDEQVTYWEPTKMVAKLRELKTDDNELILKMKMTAGHAGSSARYTMFKEIAFNWAFVFKCLGISR